MVEESKRFGLPLDARDTHDGHRSRTPHGQMLRYLSTADIESESRVRWGILTSGGVWRLYDYRARPRATGYFEADLGQMLESGETRTGCDARLPPVPAELLHAAAGGRRPASWKRRWPRAGATRQQVTEDISGMVFERVFPSLVASLGRQYGGRSSQRSARPP